MYLVDSSNDHGDGNRLPERKQDPEALATAIANASADGGAFELVGANRLDTQLTLTSSFVRVRGSQGARLVVDNRGVGCEIAPVPVPIGEIEPAKAGATTLTANSARWRTDEHRGTWVEVVDEATHRRSGAATRHVRRVMSNSADTLFLEHPIGRDIAQPSQASLSTPLEEVVLDDLRIDRGMAGGTNLVVRYCKSVLLKDISLRDGGDQRRRSGNGVSLYHCDKVRMSDIETVDSANFGLFVYNCDDVVINRYSAHGWGGQFGLQFKDCRDAMVTASTCIAKHKSGNNGFNLKCSGLNPAYNVRAVDCTAERSRQSNFEFSSITAEGSFYSARDFHFVRCRSIASNNAGFSTVLDSGSSPRNWTWQQCEAVRSKQVGFRSPAPGHTLVACKARSNGLEAVTVTSDGVQILGGTFEANCQRYPVSAAAPSSEIFVDANDTTIRDVTFRRTSASKARYAVRESQPGDTIIRNCDVEGTSDMIPPEFVRSAADSS